MQSGYTYVGNNGDARVTSRDTLPDWITSGCTQAIAAAEVKVDSAQPILAPELASGRETHRGTTCVEAISDVNEENWRSISRADRDYLLAQRDWPDPCPWCGGRLVHPPVCDELRREWVPSIPFGKHRGRRADELPADYIDWILSRGVGTEAFRNQLRRWRHC